MPYDDARYRKEKKDPAFETKGFCYRPPPKRDDNPPPPMGASREAIDKWDKEHNYI